MSYLGCYVSCKTQGCSRVCWSRRGLSISRMVGGLIVGAVTGCCTGFWPGSLRVSMYQTYSTYQAVGVEGYARMKGLIEDSCPFRYPRNLV